MDAARGYVACDAEVADVGFVAHAVKLADGDVIALVVADSGDGEVGNGRQDDDCGDDDLERALLGGRHIGLFKFTPVWVEGEDFGVLQVFLTKKNWEGTFRFLWRIDRYKCGNTTGERMGESKLDLLQGTLDLMVLQTLAAMGEMHGYGIARRIEQVSGDEVLLNQGTIYAALVRLQQRGWIAAEWGTSDNNRKAKFYSITKRGRKQLAEDAAYWVRLSSVMGRVLAMGSDGGER